MERRNERTGERIEKRIFRRFRYTDEYRTQTYVGANGKSRDRVTYIGRWYCPVNDADEYRSIVVWAWVCVLVAALAALGALASVPTPMEHRWYLVVLALALFPLAYAIMGAARLPRKPQPMEHSRYDKSVLRMKHSAVAVLAILGLTAIGCIVYAILAAADVIVHAAFSLGDGFFLVCILTTAAASVLLYTKMKQIKSEVRENSMHHPS